MAPRIDGFEPVHSPSKSEKPQGVMAEDNELRNRSSQQLVTKENNDQLDNLPVVWRNVAIFSALHVAALYGVYCCFYAKYQTLIFAYLMYVAGGLGITAGAHRLWAHRTYKAKLPLRILLALFQTIALQNSIYEWSRDHRVHHKHAETNADPHNAKRGFFFSHMGWLLMKKHPDVMKKGSRIPLDDLLADPVVRFQKKYYKTLAVTCCFVLPTILPVILWNESITNAYFVPAILRYIVTLHVTWLVNSVAHMWGFKPYDKNINPVENFLVSIGAVGEGFHNFHHTFPQDYATSEYGAAYFNLTKGFIDFMALIGQSYDRNKISPETILQRRKRTGDLSSLHYNHDHDHHNNPDQEHDY